MSFPDFKKSFIVYCDASETGLGAVLCQNQDGKLNVISYALRTLTPAKKNYHLHPGKLKFLALKWAIGFVTTYCTVHLLMYTRTTTS